MPDAMPFALEAVPIALATLLTIVLLGLLGAGVRDRPHLPASTR